ncbi:MAG TPA: ferredoxin [Acidimicrobiales bacterium]|nr:ferredoxin [Acidimicrobiales bacterium]
MRVSIDAPACQGHGRCYSLAPAVFAADEEGYALVLETEVTGPLAEQAALAAANCPERAITVEA